ncbi:MAG: hypothetical protein O4805_09170 [Trichodesmium sp. St16_bin2-tuft]|nr:hypothetical protein [Trichodesmium sp. St18_bin1]MDE5087303.1 hypothetical protein [Trichodesmium sp. St16_bin2-tuft]MDE5105659.1 hypothetical protein [Trichodesmium sp. St17_bin3_1_1]
MSFAIQGKMDYETLGKTGGISTTPGTPQWALAIKLKLQCVLKKSIVANAEQLKAWFELMKQPAAYKQLLDEQGKLFNSYEELCRAQPPYGLGCEPKEIEQLISGLELTETKKVDILEDPLKYLGNPSNYFHKFSKLVEACPDNQVLNASKIGEILDYAHSTAQLWRKRWENLGWLEQSKSSGRGFYQITESGKTAVKNWLEQQPKDKLNKQLWVVVAKNPQKAAEKLIKSFETEDLREIHKLIGESFSQESTV